MKRAAIFAMPSLHEGLGLSLQEALAKGCACIGSRVGGIPDLIQDGDNGLLVEPGNVDQLAAGLDRMMGDEALRARLSLRAPESILEKEMTVSKMIEKYDKLYQEILHGPAPLLPGASKLTSIVPDPSVARN
jgi:glycosyltransferase involved in cell wall biosynthesis